MSTFESDPPPPLPAGAPEEQPVAVAGRPAPPGVVLTAEDLERGVSITALFASHAALIRDLAAARREADRLRHGQDIEGDHVCPADLRADAAEKDRDSARAETDALRGHVVVALDAARGAADALKRVMDPTELPAPQAVGEIRLRATVVGERVQAVLDALSGAEGRASRAAYITRFGDVPCAACDGSEDIAHVCREKQPAPSPEPPTWRAYTDTAGRRVERCQGCGTEWLCPDCDGKGPFLRAPAPGPTPAGGSPSVTFRLVFDLTITDECGDTLPSLDDVRNVVEGCGADALTKAFADYTDSDPSERDAVVLVSVEPARRGVQ